VSTFQERLGWAVSGYRQRQSADGGWGEDRWQNAPSSIVNTVEVLAILRTARMRYEDPVVRKALKYLTRAVVNHPTDDEAPEAHAEARGQHTRYCAWGLCGLTMFNASRHDPRLQEAQAHCVTWLADRELREQGAWGEGPEDEHPSLLSTSAAIVGLRRVCSYHPAGPVAASLVKRARQQVRALARPGRAAKSQRTTSWALTPESRAKASASATAMAVLALADGGRTDRDLANEGARWLWRNAESWRGAVERDSRAPAANWQHMTFSLGLRAVLRGARRPSNDTGLRASVDFLEDLWSEESIEWSHGQPGARPSPSGSYAVVTAYEAMSQAWPFDAQREILGVGRGSPATPAEPAGLNVHIDAEHVITITDVNGMRVEATLQPAHFRMFKLLAERHSRGADKEILEERSWDMNELARELDVNTETVRRYARAINRVFKDEARRERQTLGDLVQFMESERVPGERRPLINVDRVTLDLDDEEP
jgi:hypothetical protein